jgi:hypothetical protein
MLEEHAVGLALERVLRDAQHELRDAVVRQERGLPVGHGGPLRRAKKASGGT